MNTKRLGMNRISCHNLALTATVLSGSRQLKDELASNFMKSLASSFRTK